MKLAITATARIRKLFDRYVVRITIGAFISLLIHGLILSLQLGLPGLGLPGLGLPWSERRAQTPDISIRIANLASSPERQQQASPPLDANDAPPKPQETAAASDQSLTELPNAHVKQAPSRVAPVAPHTAKALKSSPAIAAAIRKKGSPPPDDQSSPAPARAQVDLIALAGDHADTFSVPAPDLDSWWRSRPKVENIPLPIQSLEEAAPPTIAAQSPQQTIERSQELAPALQKPAELESFERPDEMKAQEPETNKTSEVAAEVAQHKEGEEIAAQENAHKLEEQEAAQRAQDNQTKKLEEERKEEEAAKQIAAKKHEEAQLAQREQVAAEKATEKKLEQEQQKKLADIERQAKELSALKQAEEIARQQAAAVALQQQREAAQLEELKRQEQEQEKIKQQAIELAARQQAEEIARQKALEIERQKREHEEQAAALKKAQEIATTAAAVAQKAQEVAAAQKAEVEAAARRENARAAAIAAATSTGNGTNTGKDNTGTGTNGNTGNQSRGAGSGDLVSKALSQVGKIDLTRLAPPPSNDAEHPEEDTRRRSIFGIVDHDVVVDAYIRSWRNKIERNGSLNYSQSSKDLARENPVVTVAIRSDGSVEDVIINRSSGLRELDEDVMRIVRVNAPYSKFPENLARKYPVIEIRRVWSFEDTLKILEEVH